MGQEEQSFGGLSSIESQEDKKLCQSFFTVVLCVKGDKFPSILVKEEASRSTTGGSFKDGCTNDETDNPVPVLAWIGIVKVRWRSRQIFARTPFTRSIVAMCISAASHVRRHASQTAYCLFFLNCRCSLLDVRTVLYVAPDFANVQKRLFA